MSLFGPPNIEKLKEKGDIKGLINALGYKKDSSIHVAAAKVLSEWVSYGSNKEQAIEMLKENKDIAVESLVAAILEKQYQSDRDHIAETLEILGWTPDQNDAGFSYWVGKRNWDKAGAYGASKLASLLEEVGFNIPERADIATALGIIGDPRAVESLLAVLNKDRENDQVRRSAAQALVKIGVEETKNNDLVKLALFESVSTTGHNKAVQLLFDQALQAVPALSAKMINSLYADVKPRWGCLKLVEGSEKEIRNLIRKSLKHIKDNTPKGTKFQVTTVIYARAAQVNAIHGNSFSAIRVWRKDASYCACGNPNLIPR